MVDDAAVATPSAGGSTVADELERLVQALRGVDDALGGARRVLGDGRPDVVAPAAAGASLATAVGALRTRLGETAAEAGDGARAVHRHVDQLR